MEPRRRQLARLRRVAEAAVDLYPLPAGRLTFVAHGENTTYRHDSPTGSYLIRVHRPDRHGRHVDPAAAVGSELAWLRALRTETELAVPEPLEARDGSTTVAVSAGSETRTCSVLRWMEGRIHESTPRPIHLHRLGEAMARLHLHADEWTPPPGFVRIRWDHATFFGDVMVYGHSSAAECWSLLPSSLRRRFQSVADRMAEIMATDEDVGLIHADLHLGNAVFHRGVAQLIDFDDCGTGPRLYDLAVALWELRERPDYPSFRNALVMAYRSRREVDLTHLDDYIATRQLAFALWFTGMAQVNPVFASQLDGVHQWSLEMLDRLEGSPTVPQAGTRC